MQGKEELVRWEEGKKWQKKVEVLRNKLKEKNEEVERMEKANTLMKDALTRQEKEKLMLQNKLRK